jgi:mono/diheme cytochrome c family protein
MARVSRVLRGVTLAVFIASVAASISAQQPAGNEQARKLKNPSADDPESVATGQKLFRTYCRQCHGNDAKGDGPQAPKDSHPPNLTDDKWDHGSSDGEIFTVIRDGAGPKFVMKGFRSKLTQDEMWSLVSYLRSLGTHAGSH